MVSQKVNPQDSDAMRHRDRKNKRYDDTVTLAGPLAATEYEVINNLLFFYFPKARSAALTIGSARDKACSRSERLKLSEGVPAGRPLG